jgi:hypothetical protein
VNSLLELLVLVVWDPPDDLLGKFFHFDKFFYHGLLGKALILKALLQAVGQRRVGRCVVDLLTQLYPGVIALSDQRRPVDHFTFSVCKVELNYTPCEVRLPFLCSELVLALVAERLDRPFRISHESLFND